MVFGLCFAFLSGFWFFELVSEAAEPPEQVTEVEALPPLLAQARRRRAEALTPFGFLWPIEVARTASSLPSSAATRTKAGLRGEAGAKTPW